MNPRRLMSTKNGRSQFVMNLSNALQMDPNLLLGLLNTELRNHCDSLEDLVKTHDIDPQLLSEKMAVAGYVYHPEQNQFR